LDAVEDPVDAEQELPLLLGAGWVAADVGGPGDAAREANRRMMAELTTTADVAGRPLTVPPGNSGDREDAARQDRRHAGAVHPGP